MSKFGFDGKCLMALRRAAGVSRSELAERTGLARRTIEHYEQNKRQPRADGLALLACILDCKVDDLFSGRDGVAR